MLKEPSSDEESAEKPKRGGFRYFTRRNFLLASGGAAATVLYTRFVEPHWIVVEDRDLPIHNLPAELQGKTLIQISDLHAGDLVDTAYLQSAMRQVSALKPDMTVITGDLMSCHGTEQIGRVQEVLKHLTVSPLGNFAVLGNHDYGQRWRQEDAADGVVLAMQDAGIETLRNEVKEVGGLQLVGVDDFWGPRFDPESVIREVDWRAPALTLCHNPDAVDLPVFERVKGWVLAGHTHGGQCKPPFLPPPLLPVQNRRYTSGAFDLEFGRQLYISRGLGYTMHVRFNAPPEITRFRLVSA